MSTNRIEPDRAPSQDERAHAASQSPPTADDVATCIRVLEAFASDRALLASLGSAQRKHLLVAAGRVSRPERDEQRHFAKALRRRDRLGVKSRDERLLDAAGIRVLRADPSYRPPPRALAGGGFEGAAQRASDAPAADSGPELARARKCYICKAEFRTLHFFYDQLCPPCAQLNYVKRMQTADLRGRVALVTGGRVKIGYQTVLLLLRAGARVVVTTRFPHDAAKRYASEPDFEGFRDRLAIYGLDLRHTASVERFTAHLRGHLERLDFIINNACQTVRRPPGFYGHLMAAEGATVGALDPAIRPLLGGYDALRARGEAPLLSSGTPFIGLRDPALLSQLVLTDEDRAAPEQHFPRDRLDADLQQVDLRPSNSWRLQLADVPTVELLEVQLVNAIAPFVLNARLKDILVRERTFDKHIVNVSAMEGQFYRRFKTDKHPHTNMAKAALNMLTRTSAADYARDGIFMNSVDTGWITDEDPAAIAERKREEHGFHPPLDAIDGAARIVDPIFSGFRTGQHAWGQFFKDYAPSDW